MGFLGVLSSIMWTVGVHDRQLGRIGFCSVKL